MQIENTSDTENDKDWALCKLEKTIPGINVINVMMERICEKNNKYDKQIRYACMLWTSVNCSMKMATSW